MKYLTHAGRFHTDEIAGYCICYQAGVCDSFERLYNTDNLADLANTQKYIIADIGRVYDPKKRMFDHHQEFLLRDNGYPYASAGLLWKEYGYYAVLNLIGGEETDEHAAFIKNIVDYIDETFIQGIDANDSDGKYSYSAKCVAGPVKIMTLPQVIDSLNSSNVNDQIRQQNQFRVAANLFIAVLEKKIIHAKNLFETKNNIHNVATFDGDIMILSQNVNWDEIVADDYPHIKYVIAKSDHPGNKFSMIAVKKHIEEREVKIPIERPIWFEGFIHQGKWIAGANTIEELIELGYYNIKKFYNL